MNILKLIAIKELNKNNTNSYHDFKFLAVLKDEVLHFLVFQHACKRNQREYRVNLENVPLNNVQIVSAEEKYYE